MTANPLQWPQFVHVGIWYADVCRQQVEEVQILAVLLQRWWRRNKKNNAKPMTLSNRRVPVIYQARTIASCRARIQSLKSILQGRTFEAYEKLDGTNFGIRSDGAMFGRRQVVTSDTYQRVPLRTGALPTIQQIKAVQNALLPPEFQNKDYIQAILYGELMCNPGKFDYTERTMDHKFYCFGVMLQYTNGMINDKTKLAIQEKMRERGFNSTGKCRVVLNEKLMSLLQEHDILTAPRMAEGASLANVCQSLQARLMRNDFEGVVLTCRESGLLLKYKTGQEDESRSGQEARAVLNRYPSWVLELAGVDVQLLQCLVAVALNKNDTSNKKMRRQNNSSNKKDKKAAYDTATLEFALESAMTKFDALEAYFERDARQEIVDCLRKEVQEDLNAVNSAEIKVVASYINRSVGIAYGAWKSTTARNAEFGPGEESKEVTT